METIRGRMSHDISSVELSERIAHYNQIQLDLGTGDGRFVRWMADRQKDTFFIGVDACRENLRATSRIKLPNAMFVIASAQALPFELNGLASQININFPWGSLLASLLNNDVSLIQGLLSITRPYAKLKIHLNGEALTTAGWMLEAGADQMETNLNTSGWVTRSGSCLTGHELRSIPTTWAKRLVFGRDPRAIRLSFQRRA